ncbi:MAG: YcxB family protein [Clostridiales bacterium]|nr:YcxB family protein [Clostridiales bacterium]
MATNNKNIRELKFTLNDDDYKAFGRYRILYTRDGQRIVNKQRWTFIIVAIGVIIIFALFPVGAKVFKMTVAIMTVAGLCGVAMSKNMVLKQQARAIDASSMDIERVRPAENKITFYDEFLSTIAGADESTFTYTDIKLVDLTEEGIYVWMSDKIIMPLPAHAFRTVREMEDTYMWLIEKNPKAETN